MFEHLLPSVGEKTLWGSKSEIHRWVDGFLVAKRAQHLTPGTVTYYRIKIYQFMEFCEERRITTLDAVDPSIIREFLLCLEQEGHNPGGTKGDYTCIRTFLRWYEDEAAPDRWRNPIRKVKASKVPEEILTPVALEDVWRMLEGCDSSRMGIRDRAIILIQLDTGVRAAELLAANVDDLEPVNGASPSCGARAARVGPSSLANKPGARYEPGLR